jgi:hypothetical protein
MKYESKAQYHMQISLYSFLPWILILIGLAFEIYSILLLVPITPLLAYLLIEHFSSLEVEKEMKDALIVIINGLFAPLMFIVHPFMYMEYKLKGK